jgi:hypothetical protein
MRTNRLTSGRWLRGLAGVLLAAIAGPTHALVFWDSAAPISSLPGAITLSFGVSPLNNGGALNVALPSGTIGGGTYAYTGGALFNFDASSLLPNGISARPPGSAGNFWSIGISPAAQSSTGVVNFASGMQYFGFLWGSPDAYNHVSYYDGDELLGTFDGSAILVPPNGDQTFSRYFNVFAGAGEKITRVTFISTSNAFETDNHAVIAAVPAPGSLALVALALVAFAVSRRRTPL